MSNFSKRKYLKKPPKQKAIQERKIIDHDYSIEIPKLYASTETTLEEYLIEEDLESYNEVPINQGGSSLKKLRYTDDKKKILLNDDNIDKSFKNNITVKNKKTPTTPTEGEKNVVALIFLLPFIFVGLYIALSNPISSLLERWREKRKEKREMRRQQKKPKLRKLWFFVLLVLGIVVSSGLGFLLGLGLSYFVPFIAALILIIPAILAFLIWIALIIGTFGAAAGSPEVMSFPKTLESWGAPSEHIMKIWVPWLLEFLPILFGVLIGLLFVFIWLKNYKKLTQIPN